MNVANVATAVGAALTTAGQLNATTQPMIGAYVGAAMAFSIAEIGMHKVGD